MSPSAAASQNNELVLAAKQDCLAGFVFTGGIREKAVTVRAAVCRRLTFLGFYLDPGRDGGRPPHRQKGFAVAAFRQRAVPIP